MKIKCGFSFLIAKNYYTGEVISIDINNKIATCAFFDNDGYLYKICDVYVSTIKNNLETGKYEELRKGV